VITIDFERRYRHDPDPWGYRSSVYEASKYAATLRACGPGPFAAALELGGSIGVFSAMLAPRCAQLTTIDSAPTAVVIARRELADWPHAVALVGEIPQAIPEVLYYLHEQALGESIERLGRVLTRGGRLVAVHWRPIGPERHHSATQIHDRLTAESWLVKVAEHSTTDYLLTVLERP
jgi:protein-L-isoaspartate O-methyltransferase